MWREYADITRTPMHEYRDEFHELRWKAIFQELFASLGKKVSDVFSNAIVVFCLAGDALSAELAGIRKDLGRKQTRYLEDIEESHQ